MSSGRSVMVFSKLKACEAVQVTTCRGRGHTVAALGHTTCLSRENAQNVFHHLYMYSVCQTTSKAQNSFVNCTCTTLSNIFSNATSFRNCLGLRTKVSKWLRVSLPDISMVYKFGELLGGYCSISIICGQFS